MVQINGLNYDFFSFIFIENGSKFIKSFFRTNLNSLNLSLVLIPLEYFFSTIFQNCNLQKLIAS